MVPCIYWDVDPCRPSPPSGDCESRSVLPDSLHPFGPYSPWNSLGQKTGVGSPSLLHGIFPTQGSNPGLPHCRQILYQLSHKESSYVLSIYIYIYIYIERERERERETERKFTKIYLEIIFLARYSGVPGDTYFLYFSAFSECFTL